MAGIYPANQNNLKSFQKALIGWKAGSPKKPLLFYSCKRLLIISHLGAKQSIRRGGPATQKTCKQNRFVLGTADKHRTSYEERLALATRRMGTSNQHPTMMEWIAETHYLRIVETAKWPSFSQSFLVFHRSSISTVHVLR